MSNLRLLLVCAALWLLEAIAAYLCHLHLCVLSPQRGRMEGSAETTGNANSG